MRIITSVAILVATTAATSPAQRPPASLELTLDEAMSLSAHGSPDVVAQRARVGLAEARLLGARTPRALDPELTVGLAHRDGSDEPWEPGVEFAQAFEPAARRHARIEGAVAGVARQRALARDAARRLAGRAGRAFVNGLAARERLALERERLDLTRRVRVLAERRHAAGDVGGLDVALAQAAEGRGRAAVEAARADALLWHAELAGALGVPWDREVVLVGDLRSAATEPRGARLRAAADRADLQALRAGLREAEAELELGRAARRADIGFFAGWEREESADVLSGGLTIRFARAGRGRELIASGHARRDWLRAELGAREHQALTSLAAALERHAVLSAAVAAHEREVAPAARRTLDLTRVAYEEGALAITGLLAAQAEAIGVRLAHVDLLTEAALAALEARIVAGDVPSGDPLAPLPTEVKP